jgi:hypothetical protein
VAKKSKRLPPELPVNNTVKLTETLRLRISQAMEAGGFSVWSEFCRVALTEKCRAIKGDLRTRDPAEYARIYGRES